jgi:putative transposase
MAFKARLSSPRLSSFDYAGPHAYHLVLSTLGRRARFTDRFAVAFCIQALEASAKRYSFDVIAYCFMPDHLHLLVQGDGDAPLVRFVQHFKQATGYRYPRMWQRSYYDHILRQEEAIEDAAHYIWNNPVRAGLVDEAASFAHSGPAEKLAAYGGDRAKALSLHGRVVLLPAAYRKKPATA